MTRRNLLGGLSAGMLVGRAVAATAQSATTLPAAATLAPIEALIDAARTRSPQLATLMTQQLPGLTRGGATAVRQPFAPATAGMTTVPTVASGNVAAVWGQQSLFSVAGPEPAMVSIDRQPALPMTREEGTPYWYRLETLRLGTTHTYTLFVDGRDVGTGGVAGYNPDSYEQSGVARGTLSERRTIRSRVYPGVAANYWVYANAGIDTVRGAPLMVWQDGSLYVGPLDLINYRLQIVSDNLVAGKAIPPMVHVFISPGTGGAEQPLRFPGDTQDNEIQSAIRHRFGSLRPVSGERGSAAG